MEVGEFSCPGSAKSWNVGAVEQSRTQGRRLRDDRIN